MSTIWSYAQIGRYLSEHSYGVVSDTIEDAARKTSREDARTYAVFALLERVEGLFNGLVEPVIRQKATKLHAEMVEHFTEQIRERELKHGPCPYIVEKALFREAKRNLASCISESRWQGVLEYSYDWIEPPEKGTEARKEYDRWMKRKPRKKKDGES